MEDRWWFSIFILILSLNTNKASLAKCWLEIWETKHFHAIQSKGRDDCREKRLIQRQRYQVHSVGINRRDPRSQIPEPVSLSWDRSWEYLCISKEKWGGGGGRGGRWWQWQQQSSCYLSYCSTVLVPTFAKAPAIKVTVGECSAIFLSIQETCHVSGRMGHAQGSCCHCLLAQCPCRTQLTSTCIAVSYLIILRTYILLESLL